MNIKRGLFRMWVVISVLYVVTVIWVSYNDKIKTAFENQEIRRDLHTLAEQQKDGQPSKLKLMLEAEQRANLPEDNRAVCLIRHSVDDNFLACSV